jgi:hypothetical protein
MSNVVRSAFQAASQRLIAKLIKAGYLRPALRNDPAAVANAIARLKQDLRGGGDDGGPRPPDGRLPLSLRLRCAVEERCGAATTSKIIKAPGMTTPLWKGRNAYYAILLGRVLELRRWPPQSRRSAMACRAG